MTFLARSLSLAVCGWILLAATTLPASAQDFFFKPNDRIVFLGDSITEQYQYSTYLELYLTTRLPEWKLTFINAGIGGDTATGGARRFAQHVLAERPTCVTINFGMNDAGYGQFDPNRHQPYMENTAKMLAMAKEAGVRVALMSPNAVDRRVQEKFKLYVETQKEFYAGLPALAKEHGAAFADQYGITRAALEKMEADKAEKVLPYYDGFHTSPPGGLLMAHAILTALHAPALVSAADLSAPVGVQKVENCEVSMFRGSTNGCSFTRLDKALPLPVQADWVSLLPYVNNLADLNAYRLKVTGLAAGTYVVKIDMMDVAEFTAEQLAAGVDLGNLTRGPVFQQSQQVFQKISEKNDKVHKRFRGVVMAKEPEDDAGKAARVKDLDDRMTEISKLQDEIYELAKPVARRWTVTEKKN